MASKDLDRPGGVWTRGALRLGDLDVLDGTGEVLTVTHIGPSGFRGEWQSDLGIAVIVDSATNRALPNPGGYFCAIR
jgi:hypothetical protein